jgi:hypothetical protein
MPGAWPMLLVFGCHDYGNGYFYRMWIWISYGNRCRYLRHSPRWEEHVVWGRHILVSHLVVSMDAEREGKKLQELFKLEWAPNTDVLFTFYNVHNTCIIDQIHGLNWVLANKVKNFKIHYMVIWFYDQFVCYWKWNTPTRHLSTSSAAEIVQEDTHKNLD